MKNFLVKVFVFILVLSALSLSAFASEGETEEPVYPTEGYVYNSEGKETNIKWTITTENELNVCRFEIDKTATDKVQSTVVGAYTAEGKKCGWSNNKDVPWYYDGQVNKMVFGEGITSADGGVYMVISRIYTIEVSKDFKKTGWATFEANAGLKTFYVTGSEEVTGHGDFSSMTEIGSYCFDGSKFVTADFSGSLKDIPAECFKNNKFKEIVFPANIESISERAFVSNASLQKVTFENAGIKINATAFDKCNQLFTIIGHKGSTAETFASEGGYEFVDIETGEVLIVGTRKVEKDPAAIMAEYPLEEADDSGLLTGEYNGSTIINTYWAYFKDSKTIVFINNASGYNETGNGNSKSDSPTKYTEYKFEAEHVIIGTGIHKVSQRAFEGFKALKTVAIGTNIAQIDQYAFHNCTSLTSIYKLGQEPVEKTANMTMVSKYSAGVLKNTGIETVNIKSGVKADALNDIAFIGCKNIVATVDEAMIEFAKSNFYNLINIDDAGDVYEYYKYINPDTTVAGASSIASFDKETGTLTILGSGDIYDIVNYYGGGSKQQPWFSFKQDIKKIIIGPKITYIGKYAFCQCRNLEEIELPASEIAIGAGAFEKCYNLRSVYVSGSEPVLGTFDLRTVPAIDSWTFAYNYLVVNPIISDKVTEIGSSTFEDCMNLATVYGVPGSYAETFASEKGYAFADISVETPLPKLATPPEMNQDEKEKAEREAGDTEAVETEPIEEIKPLKYHFIIDAPDAPTASDVQNESNSGSLMIYIIIGAAAAVVIAVLAVIIIGKKKKSK
ncbi:MAG: leucine-rich repeat protein [Clostridia bacterium]|nr:leucine-rich repeat protein [Clostridia bacterium]